jgi:hypothetical protein
MASELDMLHSDQATAPAPETISGLDLAPGPAIAGCRNSFVHESASNRIGVKSQTQRRPTVQCGSNDLA